LLTDIQKGDLFFQCTDGVLETWNDDDLQALFTAINDPDKILEKLKKECEQYSKDNFTAIVYRIEEAFIDRNISSNDNYVDAIPVKNNNESTKSNSNFKEHIAEPKPTLKGLLNLKILGVRLVLWVVILISLFIAIKFKDLLEGNDNKGKGKTAIGVTFESNKGLISNEKNKIISEVYESIDENLEVQGYSKKKPDIDNNQIESDIEEIEDKINKTDTLNSDGKKQKKILKDKKQVLERKLENQKDFIKLNDSIIYYKKK
jgi:hypothetical protein